MSVPSDAPPLLFVFLGWEIASVGLGLYAGKGTSAEAGERWDSWLVCAVTSAGT